MAAIRFVRVVLLVNFIALAIGGCEATKRSQPLPPDWGEPQTSISNVIDNFKRALIETKADRYAAQLADSFTFAFAQQDIGGSHNNPATWNRVADVLSMTHMCGKQVANTEGYVCDTIAFSFDRGTPVTDPDHPNWTKLVLSNIYLTVVSHKQDTLDPLNYEVSGDQAYLYFAQSGSTWKLIRWEDHPIQHKGATSVNSTTIGKIKSSWH